MARREVWTVKELIIEAGGGIRIGNGRTVRKTARGYRCVPALKDADRYFASANMHNGPYTVANSGLPGDGLAHNVTCLETITDAAEDTNGILTVTGLDINGEMISEVITPNGGATIEGVKAFAKVTSIVGSGWVVATNPDTIVIGFGDVQGLPECLAAAEDIILNVFNGAIVDAPTVVVDSYEVSKNTIVAAGDASKILKVIYLA